MLYFGAGLGFALAQVWPTPPPKPAKDEPRRHALDALGAPALPKQKPQRTGGIQYVVGNKPAGGMEPKPASDGDSSDKDSSLDGAAPDEDGKGAGKAAGKAAKGAGKADKGAGKAGKGGKGAGKDKGDGPVVPPPPPPPAAGGKRGGRGRGGRGRGAAADAHPHLEMEYGYIIINDDIGQGYMDFKAVCNNPAHQPCTLTRRMNKKPLAALTAFLQCAAAPGAHKLNAAWRDTLGW